MYPIGELKVIRGYSPAGDTTTGERLRPPVGYEWLFVTGHLLHYSATAKNCAWLIYDAVQEESMGMGLVSRAFGVYHWFEPICYQTPKFTNNVYLIGNVLSIDGDKHIEYQLMILERPENLELLLRDWYSELVNSPIPALTGLKYRMEHYRGGL